MSAFILILILSFISFMFFSVSVETHYRQLYGQKTVPKRAFWWAQSVGWLLLLVSLYPAITHWGVGIGLMGWLLIITLGAMLVVALVNFAPKTYKWVWNLLKMGLDVAPSR